MRTKLLAEAELAREDLADDELGLAAVLVAFELAVVVFITGLAQLGRAVEIERLNGIRPRGW